MGEFSMTDALLPADPDAQKDKIVHALYLRLHDVRRSAKVQVPENDEFELGIDCRLANELMWLEDIIDRIERS
jgi:hypothetical protein